MLPLWKLHMKPVHLVTYNLMLPTASWMNDLSFHFNKSKKSVKVRAKCHFPLPHNVQQYGSYNPCHHYIHHRHTSVIARALQIWSYEKLDEFHIFILLCIIENLELCRNFLWTVNMKLSKIHNIYAFGTLLLIFNFDTVTISIWNYGADMKINFTYKLAKFLASFR